jgi:hypothetical protein
MPTLIPLSLRRACERMPALPACVFAVLVMLAATVRADGPASCPDCPTSLLPTADIVPDLPPKPPGVQVPVPNDPTVQARLPGCMVWTDRCVTCTRLADLVSCSNIGIACQPQAVECVEQEKPADDKPPAEKKPEK